MSTIQHPTRVGQRARVVEPGDPYAEWDGAVVEVIEGDDFQTSEGSLLTVEDINRPGRTTSMFAYRLEVIEPAEDVYTVHDAEGIDALPVGTVLEDVDGDRYEKRESGHFYTTERDYEPLLVAFDGKGFARDYAAYGPWLIVYPEALEPKGETFEPGDKVRIASPAGTRPEGHRDGIGYVAPGAFGKTGTVRGVASFGEGTLEVLVDVDDERFPRGLVQGIHESFLTKVEEETSEPLTQWEQELLDILPTAEEEATEEETAEEEHVPYGSQDDVSVEQNDAEKMASDDIIEAIMATLEPGDVVEVMENPRVFDVGGVSSYLNLVEGEKVTVVSVPDDCNGYYLAGRTLEVRRESGMSQYADVTALLPTSEEQIARVDAYLASKKGEEADAATEGDALAELLALLGITDEEQPAEEQPAEDDPVAQMEAIDATMPTTPVARRLAALTMAQEVFPDADEAVILSTAAFILGDG